MERPSASAPARRANVTVKRGDVAPPRASAPPAFPPPAGRAGPNVWNRFWSRVRHPPPDEPRGASDDDPPGGLGPPWLIASALLLAGVSLVTGLLGFFAWMLPEAFHHVLPEDVIHGPHHLADALGAALPATHLAAGLGFLFLGLLGVARAVSGRDRWYVPDHETATSAFWRWALGLAAPMRVGRLHFRDALLYPVAEALFGLSVAVVTIGLRFVPISIIADIGIGLHRVNAFYLVFLALYSLMVLAFKRRGESPFPTVIRGGRLVRRHSIHVEGSP